MIYVTPDQAAILDHIASASPDASATRPTLRDYDRFDRWVIDTYGLDMLVTFKNASQTGWTVTGLDYV